MKVLLIGGSGFIGKHIKKTLKKYNPELHVITGTRSPKAGDEIYFDILNEKLFNSLKNFNFIINCSDTFIASPLSIIDYCLFNNLVFLEITADSNIIEKILHQYRNTKQLNYKITGSVIIGLGIFPGLSNILAGYLLKNAYTKGSIELGIKTNFFSGAGKSMAKLMVDMIDKNAVYYLEKEKREIQPMTKGTLFPLYKNGIPAHKYKSLYACFAEAVMLNFSTSASFIACYYIPSSKLIYFSLRSISLFTNRFCFAKKIIVKVLYGSIIFIRNFLFKNVSTPVTIFCIANQKFSTASPEFLTYKFEDGILDMTLMISAILKQISNKLPLKGVWMPDELFDIEELSFINKDNLRISRL